MSEKDAAEAAQETTTNGSASTGESAAVNGSTSTNVSDASEAKIGLPDTEVPKTAAVSPGKKPYRPPVFSVYGQIDAVAAYGIE